jgi:hypothetical protein
MRLLHSALCKKRPNRIGHVEAAMKIDQKRTPRELMELAIKVMRRSVPEPRADGKASPVNMFFAQCAVQKT